MKKRLLLLTALFAGALGGIVSHVRASITIASNGKSDYAIILPVNAPASIKDAADELQKDIRLATGAKLAIQVDSQDAARYISLGGTRQAAAAGITHQGLSQGAYRIVTRNGNLYIIGPDTVEGTSEADSGTANGVYCFLEDELDVRWLMPGEIGRDVPGRATFQVGEIDRTYAPMFTWRQETHLWDFADYEQTRAIMRWTARQRHATNPGFDYDHNWWRAINEDKRFPGDADGMVRTPAVRRLYQEHPDWFAMDAHGSRPYPDRHYAKLETTNPELVKYFAELAVKALKANPKLSHFSLSPSDGRGWSQSPQSKALYDPPHHVFTDAAMGSGSNPGMSSLVLKWYHDVAQIVAREYPQGKLSGYIYADYVAPPTKYAAKLPENFTPMICGVGTYGYGLYRPDNRDYYTRVMDSWGKTVAKTWFYYDLPNQLLRQHDDGIGSGSYSQGNFPGSTAIVSPAAPRILNFLFSTLVRNHISGAYIYGVPSWSNAALANYLLAKMMWDPTQDAVKLQRQWLERAYGSQAGAVMEQFYNDLDQWLGDYVRTHPGNGELLTLEILREVYAAHYEAMEKTFLRAAAQSMSDVQKRRLEMIGDNLIALQWRLRNADLWPAGLSSKLQRTNEQVIALLTKDNKAFPLFPGLVPRSSYNHPTPPTWTVRRGTVPSTGPATDLSGMDANMFLLYAPADTTVRIVPMRVSHGAFFASYLVRDAKGKTVTWGVMDRDALIQFQAKANTPYYLYIPPRKPVGYDLSIPNAAIAQGRLDGGTLTLAGPPTTVYVLSSPGNAPIGLFSSGNGVNLVKPYSGAAGMAHLLHGDYYRDVEVAAALDTGWKFHPDPKDQLLAQGVTRLDFDDSAWKTVTALDWWQMQGFKDYHGVAWYRIQFNLDQAPPPKPRRARIYFGGVDGNMIAYLNGKEIFQKKLGPAPTYKGWDVPGSWDVTWDLKKGANILVVKVTSKNATTASGIFKGVSLMTAVRTDKK